MFYERTLEAKLSVTDEHYSLNYSSNWLVLFNKIDLSWYPGILEKLQRNIAKLVHCFDVAKHLILNWLLLIFKWFSTDFSWFLTNCYPTFDYLLTDNWLVTITIVIIIFPIHICSYIRKEMELIVLTTNWLSTYLFWTDFNWR